MNHFVLLFLLLYFVIKIHSCVGHDLIVEVAGLLISGIAAVIFSLMFTYCYAFLSPIRNCG